MKNYYKLKFPYKLFIPIELLAITTIIQWTHNAHRQCDCKQASASQSARNGPWCYAEFGFISAHNRTIVFRGIVHDMVFHALFYRYIIDVNFVWHFGCIIKEKIVRR